MTQYTPSRRHLLGAAASGIAAAPFLYGPATARNIAASAPPKAEGQPMPRGVRLPASPPPAPKGQSIGLAIVGLGGYALNQIMPRIAEADHCHLAAVVSGNAEKAATVAAAYGLPEDAIYSYDSYEEIAGDDRIDAVYVILPTGLHTEFVLKAFTAGKHVICEKPMALTSAECEDMIAAGKAADRKLMIGYRCHFEPYNLKAMELMREEALGPLRVIRTAHHYRSGPSTPATNWRHNRALAGGGPLEDYGLYGIQAGLYLSGEMPVRISASTQQPANDPRFAEIFAHTASQMIFPSGATSQHSTSYDGAGANMVTVRGQTGFLTMEPATGYGGHEMMLRKGRSTETLTPGNPSIQFAAMLDHFGLSVMEGTEILTPGEMGLRDTRLIEAIYRSAETGRTMALNPDATMTEG
ncbi:Gfo/Idh/MocA family protein [Parvularcula marina]|uniref:Gfo/Idh/MocA family oxidoreductase n=1 Tax=Parvularcula marina TaxID=2292771 RepID=A0A371RH79_9PROT|nr:Gfo/Idh/MocA family oxidoreductase [Parvularcula marina]RFB04799.1 gfo/Idh/MocA family oxidoreductase [Parvularcula marina]